jgi:hypothetical protein
LEPTVALVVSSGSLEFSVSYVVDYTKRAAVQDQLFTKIVEEIANSKGRLEWASPASIVMNQPGTPDPSSSTQEADRRTTRGDDGR